MTGVQTCALPISELKISLGSDIKIELGDSAKLTAYLNFTTKSFKWSPKDSSLRCDTCLPVVVTPTLTTRYRLTAHDAAGCEVSDEIIVYVDKQRRVFVPTSFSPNGDGANERFTLFSDRSVRRIETFKVFNRWGNLVFEQNNILPNDENKGWDGTMRGVELSNEVYVYFFIVEFADGEKVIYQGDVSLIR